MSPSPQAYRRWLQFSLGRMLATVTVIAIVFGVCSGCPVIDRYPLLQPFPGFRRPTANELVNRVVVASTVIGIAFVVRATRPDLRNR